MTKVARSYRFELWEYKTLTDLVKQLDKDETATLVDAIKNFAEQKGIRPSTPCVNMLQLKESMIVTCKIYGDVSGKLKCLACDLWRQGLQAPLQNNTTPQPTKKTESESQEEAASA